MKKITLFFALFITTFVALQAQNQTYCTNPTDPLFYPWQWGLKNNGQHLNVSGFPPNIAAFTAGIDISACDAWKYSEGEGIKIAFISYEGFRQVDCIPFSDS